MAQRAIININGDLIPFSEDLDRIRTPGLGGSAVTWVPDADTVCDQLKVTANGTYSAADAAKYGYDYVVVSVPGSSVTGRDPDTGEEVEVHPDPETGEIVTTVLPTEIRVITPPTQTEYRDGEAINLVGAIIKAYSANGEELQTVPLNEVRINPVAAVFDPDHAHGPTGSTRVYASGPYSITVKGCSDALVGMYHYHVLVSNYYRNFALFSSAPERLELSGDINATVVLGAMSSSGAVYGANWGFNILDRANVYSWPEGTADELAQQYADGTLPPSGSISTETITVSWPRPGDGAVLETSFSINVTGGST